MNPADRRRTGLAAVARPLFSLAGAPGQGRTRIA